MFLGPKLVFITVLTICSASAFADGIKCTTDARPRDGNYTEIRLERDPTTNKFNLVKKVITAGFVLPSTTSEKTLVTGLTCNQDNLVADCYRIETDHVTDGITYQHMYSVTFKIVEVTELDRSSAGVWKAAKRQPVVTVEVQSKDVTPNPWKTSFAIKDSESFCAPIN